MTEREKHRKALQRSVFDPLSRLALADMAEEDGERNASAQLRESSRLIEWLLQAYPRVMGAVSHRNICIHEDFGNKRFMFDFWVFTENPHPITFMIHLLDGVGAKAINFSVHKFCNDKPYVFKRCLEVHERLWEGMRRWTNVSG